MVAERSQNPALPDAHLSPTQDHQFWMPIRTYVVGQTTMGGKRNANPSADVFPAQRYSGPQGRAKYRRPWEPVTGGMFVLQNPLLAVSRALHHKRVLCPNDENAPISPPQNACGLSVALTVPSRLAIDWLFEGEKPDNDNGRTALPATGKPSKVEQTEGET